MRHELSHVGKKPFKCPHCDYRCLDKQNLTRHVSLHFSHRKYQCDQCGAAFHGKNSLDVHIVYKHTEARQFSCNVCSKDFKTKDALRCHLRTHGNSKPHACPCCNSHFNRVYNLRRHMRAVHQKEAVMPPPRRVRYVDTPEDQNTKGNKARKVNQAVAMDSSEGDSGAEKVKTRPHGPLADHSYAPSNPGSKQKVENASHMTQQRVENSSQVAPPVTDIPAIVISPNPLYNQAVSSIPALSVTQLSVLSPVSNLPQGQLVTKVVSDKPAILPSLKPRQLPALPTGLCMSATAQSGSTSSQAPAVVALQHTMSSIPQQQQQQPLFQTPSQTMSDLPLPKQQSQMPLQEPHQVQLTRLCAILEFTKPN